MSNLENTTEELTECPQCLGVGTIFNGGDVEECSFCEGKGEVNEDKSNYFIGHLGEEFFES